jgi:microcystin-dependent protein
MEEHRRMSARKRAYVWAGITAAGILGVGALVFASVPHSFSNGETLTADNLNGNFNALDQRLTALESLLPSGTIIAFGGPAGAAGDGGASTIPSGWLLCDGSAVSRTTYATLFAAIGINFGGGDGINTFNLPDLRGRFVRGADHGAGRDPDAASRVASNSMGPTGDVVGSLQADALASHAHAITDPGHSHSAPTTNGATGTGTVEVPTAAAPGYDYIGAAPTTVNPTNITVNASGGSETRPKNVAVNYLIKL